MTLQQLDKMQEWEKIVAVAKAHGYRVERRQDPKHGNFSGWLIDPEGELVTWSHEAEDLEDFAALLPYYPGDLNRMHEVEKTLTDKYDFIAHLLGKSWTDTWTFDDVVKIVHATAQQRFDAFLLTLCDAPYAAALRKLEQLREHEAIPDRVYAEISKFITLDETPIPPPK